MKELLPFALMVLGGIAMFVLGWWLERTLNRRGLRFVIGGIVLLIAAGVGLAGGYRLVPLLLAVQAVMFFSHGRWVHVTGRETNHPQQ